MLGQDYAPSIAPTDDDQLLEIIAHLGAALIQAGSADDQIIIDHVRSNHRLALDLRHASATASREIDHASF
jgi:hypothetical protein